MILHITINHHLAREFSRESIDGLVRTPHEVRYLDEGYNFFNFSCMDFFSSFASSNASFSVNLDFETISLNLSYPSVSSTLLMNASLATSLQFITLNKSIFFFNSTGIDIVKCSIFNLSCVYFY